MISATTSQWDAIEQWSPTLFLIGGALLIGHAAISGIHAFTDVATPPDVFVTTGHLVALVGLLGLYPVLADRTPIVARAAVAVATVPLVSWAVMTVAQLLTVAGIVSSLTDVLPGAFVMLVPVSTILTYVLFGVATLRVDEGSPTVGLLVLAPAALIVVFLVGSAITGASATVGFVIGGGLALSMLVLGYNLRTWNRQSERLTPTDDATVG